MKTLNNVNNVNIGYVYDETMILHKNEHHPIYPEKPERIKRIYQELESRQLISKMFKVDA